MRTHTKRRRHMQSGIQHLWGLDNGHLVSVVPDAEQQTLWELTVFDGTGRSAYTLANGHDAIGALKPVDVRRILRQVEELG